MASVCPGRNVKVKTSRLDDYDGGLANILRALLLEFGCEPQIPVMKYMYYDGPVLVKCRVGLQLPAELGMHPAMAAGEARTTRTTYHIVILKAITEIREHKKKILLALLPTYHTWRRMRILHLTISNSPGRNLQKTSNIWITVGIF
jgi:hypothetical protein